MSFTQPQIEKGEWWRISGNNGVIYTPFISDLNVEPAYDGLIDGLTRFEGFGARLANTDYDKGTPWDVFPTRTEARVHLAETHNLCPVCLNEFYAEGKCSGDHD